MNDLKDIQNQIYNNKLEKGFNVTNVEYEFCRVNVELAEAFEAYRKNLPSVGAELADVAIFLYGIAEILGVDLNEEIVNKVSINKKRVYKNINGKTVKIIED